MKVTITQVYEMEIPDEHYLNFCPIQVVNDLNGVYDNIGKTIIRNCEYKQTMITEINGEEYLNDAGDINSKAGSPIILDGNEV